MVILKITVTKQRNGIVRFKGAHVLDQKKVQFMPRPSNDYGVVCPLLSIIHLKIRNSSLLLSLNGFTSEESDVIMCVDLDRNICLMEWSNQALTVTQVA